MKKFEFFCSTNYFAISIPSIFVLSIPVSFVRNFIEKVSEREEKGIEFKEGVKEREMKKRGIECVFFSILYCRAKDKNR